MFGQVTSQTGGQSQATADDGPESSRPSVVLPKGGGAIKGIGEKFAANPVSGTGSVSVPLAVSPGRSGFGPTLSLRYDSGAGNGAFGFGWSHSFPMVTRKTDKGLPRYAGDPEDTFILSSAEDLVPEQGKRGRRRSEDGREYTVLRYRPRIEGLFARIERWTDLGSGEAHWRSVTGDNVTTVYGRDAGSRVADPADPGRVFSWLICQSHDDKGNTVVYEYKAEDASGVDLSLAHERNRGRTANRYLKRIRYGNRASRFVEPDPAKAGWMFEVVFDYGEHDQDDPSPDESRPWPCRRDPFSSYRAGFEVRTHRLCRRVLMFHHFPDEDGVGLDCLTRSTDFHYREDPVASFVESVVQSGYRRDPEGGYRKKSLPPLEFGYTEPVIDEKLHTVEDVANLPTGLDDSAYLWVDLDGEGVSGVLTEQANGWFYKENLGNAHFGPMRQVTAVPSTAALRRQRLVDLAGDGQLDLVDFNSTTPGFYERTQRAGWEPFRTFSALPNLDWDNPNLRLVDLTGDGHADVLVTEDDVFSWYPSRAEEGFGPARQVYPAHDEEHGPRLLLADREQSIYLADMSGDGLTDLVRIRNGEVCYWPSLGYARFGAKVTMADAPWFDEPDQFDQRRVRVADIDGSGTMDIIYLHRSATRIYRNAAGNKWLPPHTLPFTIPNIDTVSTLDLLGNGTACLVWSSPLPSEAGRPLRYVDLMGGEKPHLLVQVRNNLGAETHVKYAPSTRFYLADKAAGRPWITRLPFPVHVVERVETVDRISRNRFVTRYAYHHGYFDGVEREFNGFGMVEQWDTETFAALNPEASNIEETSHVPPVLTRTWFHTGAFLDRNRISRQYEREYHRPLDDPTLTDTVLPDAPMTLDEQRQACRALKGSMLRQEIYALDDSEASSRPYTISERNYTVERLQPASDDDAVFFVHPRESITAHHERKLYPIDGHLRPDPRVTHDLVLAVDTFGNVLHSVTIGYGRRHLDPELTPADRERQQRTHIVSTENDYTHPIDGPDAYRTPLPSESRQWEIVGLEARQPFGFDELATKLASVDHELPYERWDAATDVPARRLIENVRTRYRGDDLTGPLPLGVVESLALPFESYRLAFTPSLLAELYGDRVDDQMLTEAGFTYEDGWWIPSGQVFYAPADEAELAYAREHFFLPHRFRDPFGTLSEVSFDRYDLLTQQVQDAVGNMITSGERDAAGAFTVNGNDYRVLQPRLVMDANRNRAAVTYDTLGMVVGTAVMGKPEEELGDTLADFDPDPNFQDDPHRLLQGATTRVTYDLFAYQRTEFEDQPQPPVVATITRETHVSDLADGEQTKIQQSFSYSDGFGREIQKKTQAEPDPEGARRWVGTGWTIFNNKGKPVRQYEPFFSATHHFEFAVLAGVSPVLFYDPVERVTATLHPNNTWEKVAFDPWHQSTWDVNDTVLATPQEDPDVGGYVRPYLASQGEWRSWYTQRIDGTLGHAEQAAAEKTANHAATPTRQWRDSLGRTFLSLVHNRFERGGIAMDERYATRLELDIEGNQRRVVDPLGRTLVSREFDILASKILVASADAGETLVVLDCEGKTLRSWDSRGHSVRMAYDPLRRPVDVHVRHGEGPERLVERTVYGEAHPDAVSLNLRSRYHQHYDGAGVVTSEANDFKGNVLRTSRRLAQEYRAIVDWSRLDGRGDGDVIADPPNGLLEPDSFVTTTDYDALNRPNTITSPDQSVVRPAYNEANLLTRVDVNLGGAAHDGVPVWTSFVTDIDYDARGRRTNIGYDNKVRTEYAYDPETFRLTRIRTTRHDGRSASDVLQDIQYTYDPTGNVVATRDDAQQKTFFDNAVVDPGAEYTFDAVYRLVSAVGREHIGQVAAPQSDWADEFRVNLAHPHDGSAMRRYAEHYEYDEVGNLLRLVHQARQGNWTRSHHYREPSSIQPGHTSNRLTSIQVGGGPVEPFAYDAHGNMVAMPHLVQMDWDHDDHLHRVDRGGGGAVYYVYDANGQRIRKVVERQNGTRQQERIYVGGFELYREHDGSGGGVTLERTTLHVMDDVRRVAIVETRTHGDDGSPEKLIRFQFDNLLGTISLELDERARLISYEEYHPFGTTAYQAVRDKTSPMKRYRFTGKERDNETGLYYHGARYYAPWLCRWTSVDPAGLLDGLDPYVYVRNNPVSLSDPTGLLSLGQWVGIAAAVVVGTVVTVATAGLAGPIVGATAAAVIGGIVGGAAGGVVGEVVEAAVDHRPITAANVGKAALIGGITGGVLAGAGVGVSAALRTAGGQALATRVATSTVGQGLASVARRVGQSVVGRGASRATAAVREPAERLGQRIAERAGVGPGARAAQAAQARAAAATMNVQGTPGVTREITSASSGQTYSHSVGWRGGHPLGPEVTGAQVEAQSALRVTPGGANGQWGEGVYAFEGGVAPNSSGTSFQFRVPPQTAVETIQIPGKDAPIIRLVPPPGANQVPVHITGTNFPAGALERGRGIAGQIGMPTPPRAGFGYPGIPSDTTGIGGGLGHAGGVFVAPIAPQDDKGPSTVSVGVRF